MAISMKETERISKEWGDKPCVHPHITKERGPMGQHTDYVCTQCGAVSFSRQDLEKQGKKVEELLNKNGE